MYLISDGMLYMLNFFAVKLHSGYLMSLIILSAILKLTTIPNKVIGFNNKKRLSPVKELLEQLKHKKGLTKNLTWIRRRVFNIRIRQLYKKQRIVSIKKRTVLVLIQLFLTIQFIHMITRIDPINGNIAHFWFNLSERDTTLILPLTVLFLNLIEGYPDSERNDLKDFVVYSVINLLIFIFALYMPSAVLVYWVTSTVLSLAINIVLFNKNAFTNLPHIRKKKLIAQKDY